MKYLILNLILLLGTLTCLAQNYIITGKVIDGNNLKPFEFVDVTIYDSSDSKIITGEFTDIDGEYIIELKEGGSYILKVAFMGYKTVEKAFTTGSEKIIKMGRIVLKEDIKKLAEVQVVGQKSGM